MNTAIYNGIVVLVTVVWTVNFVLRFVITDYQPPVQIDAIFMAIVGGAMALSRKRTGGGDPE